NATTGAGTRGPVGCAKSVMVGRPLIGAMLASFCVAGMALAETERVVPADLAGRWVAEKQKLVLDVSRCGAGWCGVEVAEGACGRTALRVAVTAAELSRDTIQGRLELGL